MTLVVHLALSLLLRQTACRADDASARASNIVLARSTRDRFRALRIEAPKLDRMIEGVALALYIADRQRLEVSFSESASLVPGGVRETVAKYLRMAKAAGLFAFADGSLEFKTSIQPGPALSSWVEVRLAKDLDRIGARTGRRLSFDSLTEEAKIDLAGLRLWEFERFWQLSSDRDERHHLFYTYGLMFDLYQRMDTPRVALLSKGKAYAQIPLNQTNRQVQRLCELALDEGFLSAQTVGQRFRFGPGTKLIPFVKSELSSEKLRLKSVFELVTRAASRP